MPVTPSNCYVCRQTWTGLGPICDACQTNILHSGAQNCILCGNIHYTYQSTMTCVRYYFGPSDPMKFCPKCKGNYLIESKAGSVCSNCHTVVHNPCRNCESTNTKGLKAPNENLVPALGTVQFIECQDCLFIE